METFNKFFVGSRAENIVIARPPMGEISKGDALLLAAYLVALADDKGGREGGQFQEQLRAIVST